MEKAQGKRNHSFRPLEDLNLIDNFLFHTISSMEDVNKDFYGILLPIILGKKVQVLDVIPQREIPGLDTDKHGIRIDAYVRAVDDSEAASEPVKPTIYDIEPNNRPEDKDSLPRRNRFYTGIIDVQKFRSGAPYDDIADLVIINILSYDPFGAGELWYEARNSLITHPDIPYEDGVRHIYLYCKGRLNPEVLRKVGIEDGESLKDMLHYFCNSRTSEAVTPELRRMDDIVHRVKERKDVSIGYMITLFHDEDLRKEGRKEGRKEERADILGLFKMLKSQNRDADIDCMLDDPERIDALLEEYYATVKS